MIIYDNHHHDKKSNPRGYNVTLYFCVGNKKRSYRKLLPKVPFYSKHYGFKNGFFNLKKPQESQCLSQSNKNSFYENTGNGDLK